MDENFLEHKKADPFWAIDRHSAAPWSTVFIRLHSRYPRQAEGWDLPARVSRQI